MGHCICNAIEGAYGTVTPADMQMNLWDVIALKHGPCNSSTHFHEKMRTSMLVVPRRPAVVFANVNVSLLSL